MNERHTEHIFLRACRREPTERTPIWLMRQAGRYLPEYRSLRAKTDFLTLCKTPELASKVSLQPVERLGVDACIIFSDILVLPEAMGMSLFIDENHGGPFLDSPIRSEADVQRLIIPDPTEKLRYVLDTLQLTKRLLDQRVPLIGFSGSPWTLACYMIEGKHTKHFRHAKEFLYTKPNLLHSLLKKLTEAVLLYLRAQVEAGAEAVQVFDTWGGLLPEDEFREFSLAPIEEIVEGLSSLNVPVIVFCKDCTHSLEAIARTGCTVVSLDWTTNIGTARNRIGNSVALQGNLDPSVLYAPPDVIRHHVKKILAAYGTGNGHIFNLGHGILPDVPVEHVKALVEIVHEESLQYHTSPL